MNVGQASLNPQKREGILDKMKKPTNHGQYVRHLHWQYIVLNIE